VLLSNRIRLTLVVIAVLLLSSIIVVFGFLSPIPQDQAYHDFAPSGLEKSNIPNTLNVITNIPFAIIGLYGLFYCSRFPQFNAPWSWRLFFLGIALIAVGSSVYHWNPNSMTLVWDRMPMTIAFMALFTALFSEQTGLDVEKVILIPLVLAGIFSVFYWHYNDDLRLYGMIQFFPLIALPVIILLMPRKFNTEHYLFYALICYIAAKIFEANDHETWQWIGYSGHAIKHLLAGCSAFIILCMVTKRHPVRSTPFV
jgi:Ceramidase